MVRKILIGVFMILFVFVGCSKVDYITCEDGTAVTDFSLCPEYVPPEEPEEEEKVVVEDISPGVDIVAEVEEPEPEYVEAMKQEQQMVQMED